MRTSRLLAVLAAGSLLLTPSATATAEEASRIKPAGAATRWITLVTGDKVLVRSQPGRPDQFVFTPTRGSGSEGAFTMQTGGHTLVIPSVAMPEVAADRLDATLFDVTALLAERYDDAGSKTMPVIVSYAGSPAVAHSRAVQDKPAGAQRTNVLASIGAPGPRHSRVAGRVTSALCFDMPCCVCD